MYNLLISLGTGTAVTLIFGYIFGTGFSLWYGLVPGILALIASYIFLARRTFKQVQNLASQAQNIAQNGNINQAVKTLKKGYPLGKWQFLVRSQLDAQIGTILYSSKKFGKAEKFLRNAFAKQGMAKAMLGTLYYKQKKFDKMRDAFEEAVMANKNDALLWNTYAYCLWKSRNRDEAIDVLNRATDNVSDDRTKSNLKALKNNKKLKMRAWGGKWYQFHLDRPPQNQFAGGQQRAQFRRR